MDAKSVVKVDVAIIGGGVAGLTTGVALTDAGLRVLVLEADTILGGRARSWTDPTTGDPVHIGPHIFLSKYPNMRKLMATVGTEERVVWDQEQIVRIVEGQREIVGKEWPLPAPLHFLPSFFADPGLTTRDRLSALRFVGLMMKCTEEDVVALDDEDGLSLM